jgi:SAM-dependent methyltransferase
VHKPAKYLSEPIKRVLWVGGGDSGVLNEFLKYPSLELAVGLELDQQVTRTAFKYFKSRPHFDNPKVQWWYGDASKSLLMLPKEYFGTFDVVVVDLSDTVFSLTVSSELDVIEAISLLLRPGGVFEMNELFLKKVSNVFEYTIHYQASDVPKICDQSAIFASNDIDFMKKPLTSHVMVEDATLLVENESLKTKHQFDRVHDYRHNPDPVSNKLCKKTDDDTEKVVEKAQEAAPGIMMVIEAENLTADLGSFEIVRSDIVAELGRLGMKVIPSGNDEVSDSRYVIMMKEGYVAVRLWPEFKYCGLDIYLWSSFDKHDMIKEAVVVNALGGDLMHRSTSSYRIVAGGMFGLPDWKETRETHGPKITKDCPDVSETKRSQRTEIDVFEQALELSFDVIQGQDLIAIVFCNETIAPCPSLDFVKDHKIVKQTISIHVCDSDGNEDLADEQLHCTPARAEETVRAALSANAMIDLIVVDQNSPKSVGSVLSNLIDSDYVDDDNIFLITTVDSKYEIWKRRLGLTPTLSLDNLGDSIGFDPINRAHILLNTTISSLELGLISSGDSNFFRHITEAVTKSQKKYPDVQLEIRSVLGGRWRTEKIKKMSDSKFSQVIVEDDYDNTDASSQWKAQAPLATQVVSQYTNCEIGTYNDKTFSCTLLKLDREDVAQACNYVFKPMSGCSVQLYDNIGADGRVCAGAWDTGTAIVSWDGQYQVDLNVWSVNDMQEIDSFNDDVLFKIPTLVRKLRDVFPRGHGRVVSFKDDLIAASNRTADREDCVLSEADRYWRFA